jgi:hypothetical protein
VLCCAVRVCFAPVADGVGRAELCTQAFDLAFMGVHHAPPPRIEFMERRAKSWLTMLERAIQTTLEWCRMQQELRLLSPIFRSDRLAPVLPEVHRKFAAVENSWLKILKTAHQSSKVCARAHMRTRTREHAHALARTCR